MKAKLSQRDVRALKIGVVAAILVLISVGLTKWFENWREIEKQLDGEKQNLSLMVLPEVKRAGLMSIVPKFEMPLDKPDQQLFNFRDKLSEQIKQAGIKSEPLQEVATKGSVPPPGYKLLCLKCTSSKCSFQQVLDLLAKLNENPYLFAVEEFKIAKSDPKKPNEIKLDLTVSTLIKSLVIPKS
jgi:hypothetical protein